MKSFNFAIGVVFCLMMAVLGQMNTGDPMKGWIVGVLIVCTVIAIGLGIGQIYSRFASEEGLMLAFAVGILYLGVIVSPILFLRGWYAVGVSFVLVIFWKLVYDYHNK